MKICTYASNYTIQIQFNIVVVGIYNYKKSFLDIAVDGTTNMSHLHVIIFSLYKHQAWGKHLGQMLEARALHQVLGKVHISTSTSTNASIKQMLQAHNKALLKFLIYVKSHEVMTMYIHGCMLSPLNTFPINVSSFSL